MRANPGETAGRRNAACSTAVEAGIKLTDDVVSVRRYSHMSAKPAKGGERKATYPGALA